MKNKRQYDFVVAALVHCIPYFIALCLLLVLLMLVRAGCRGLCRLCRCQAPLFLAANYTHLVLTSLSKKHFYQGQPPTAIASCTSWVICAEGDDGSMVAIPLRSAGGGVLGCCSRSAKRLKAQAATRLQKRFKCDKHHQPEHAPCQT